MDVSPVLLVFRHGLPRSINSSTSPGSAAAFALHSSTLTSFSGFLLAFFIVEYLSNNDNLTNENAISSAAVPMSPPMQEVTPRLEETTVPPTGVASMDGVVIPPAGANREDSSPVVLPEDFRVMIKPADCGEQLAMRWPVTTKWMTLSIIFLVQVSMNLNTTLYSNAIGPIAYEYNISTFAVRWGGAASFLIAYAFGCELWAPWSEEYGRRWVLQTSLFLVNCFAVLVATAPNWTAHVAGRTLGGLSSAGGSVTLAVITDMFQNDDPMFQHATSFIVLSSVGGSIIGPIIGGAIEEYYPWRWCIWFQLIFGFVAQVLHLVFVKETRGPVVMDKVAKERRRSGQNPHLFGPNEMSGKGRLDWAEVAQIWLRPFVMFLTEPIVLSFSLLSGFSDALIFSKLLRNLLVLLRAMIVTNG